MAEKKETPPKPKARGEQLPLPDPKAKARTRGKPAPPPPPPREPGLADQAIAIALNAFVRYKEELGAVLLITAGALTLLALAGWAGGAVLEPWARWLWDVFGLAAPLVGVTLLGGGGYVLLDQLYGPWPFPWVRFIGWEVAFCAIVPLLHLTLGPGSGRASNDAGGLVGWALARVLSAVVGAAGAGLVWTGVLLAGLAVALGISRAGVEAALGRLSERLRHVGDGTAEVEHEVLPAPPRARRERVQPAADAQPVAAPRPRRAVASAEAGSRRAAVEPESPARRAAEKEKEKAKAKDKKDKKEPVVASEPVVAEVKRPAKARPRDDRLPPLDLLTVGTQIVLSEAELRDKETIIIETLAHFGLPARIVSRRQGPAVTQFGVEPGFIEKTGGADGQARKQKVRVNQIASLSNDLALALSAQRLRIEAPVPGHSYVGIEVPNKKVNFVSLRTVLDSEQFAKIGAPLAVGLGRDMSGAPIATDLAKMPHLLIAGTTGSGKSVCISALITSLVCNNTPDDLRLVLIDPKLVELARFNVLPHVIGRVENKLERIPGVLQWVTQEMDGRYRLFAEVQARNLTDYNRKVGRRRESERLPHMVVVIDELADLMMQAPVETEQTLCRLAQMARATGIHLVVATQRPSTDVVTGLIKANFPARIAFAVASSIDSRVILDSVGAETLLGRGDMLFLGPEASAPVRVQGCYVTDKDMDAVVDYWRIQHEAQVAARAAELTAERREAEGAEAPAVPPEEIAAEAPWEGLLREKGEKQEEDPGDDLLQRAVEVVRTNGHASASLLQRRLRIGYPRAARLMDELEDGGYISGAVSGGKTRAVLKQLERGRAAADEDSDE